MAVGGPPEAIPSISTRFSASFGQPRAEKPQAQLTDASQAQLGCTSSVFEVSFVQMGRVSREGELRHVRDVDSPSAWLPSATGPL
jgi:hypothetical protein